MVTDLLAATAELVAIPSLSRQEGVIADYALRHHVRPGLTGWAQVNGARGEIEALGDMSRRVELDLWYIANWSVWLDLKILAKTLFVIWGQRKAY